MGIVLSIIVSFAFSMSADIPDGAELGGLIWIFGPLYAGGTSMFFFLVLLAISPRLKSVAGWLCIMFNLGVGAYLFFWAEIL